MSECIACSSTQPLKIVKGRSQTDHKLYEIEVCGCGLGKTVLENRSEAIYKANSEMYDDINNRLKIYYGYLHNHYEIRTRESLNTLKKYFAGKDLLEIGANIGFTSLIAREEGFNVEICDMNDSARFFAENIFQFKSYKTLLDIENKFDAITMYHVLEHFENPLNGLKEVSKKLKKNGIVLVEVPNFESKMFKRLGCEWGYLNPPDHTYHFTYNSLKLIFEKTGFEVIWHRTVSTIEDFWWVQLINGKRNKFVKLIYSNPYYYPKYYPRKEGSIIQILIRKK